MKIDLADKGWLQNRLIDLGLLVILSILVVPMGGFHFIGDTQEIHPILPWPAILGFMFPSLCLAGLFGLLGLFHHKKARWRYENPMKASFIITLNIIFFLLILGFIIGRLIPNIHDCFISFYFNAKPCSALDIDGFRMTGFYVYYGIPSLLIFLTFLIIILKPRNRISQG